MFVVATGFAVAALLASLPLAEPPVDGGVRKSSPLTATLRREILLPLWWITFVFSAALAGYFTFIKTYVDETGAGSVGLFFGVYAAVAVVLRVAAGRIPDRYGESRVLYPAIFSLAAGLLVLALFPTWAGVVVAGLLSGAGHAFLYPILYSMVITRAHPTERGTAMAIFTGLFDGGTLIGSPALGLIIATGGYGVMFGAAAAWLVAGAAIFARWDRAATG